MNTLLTTSDVLTLLIALYSACLSTLLAINELRRNKRRVKVTCQIALAPSPHNGVFKFVTIKAVNIGHRPVVITMAGLLMSNDNLFTQAISNAGENPLPQKLGDGESVTVYFDHPELKKVLRDPVNSKNRLTKALVKDAEGNTYTSKLPRALKE